ncbi:hypothetical protein ACFZB9_02145 [Kitasatospora sp. NPDC008050]|uniref:hypothetical protein n=1 Tax=Kitasatospora sp. NPDC008050 TaxID=3364021 RepID=UPI0036E3A6E2
MTDQGDMTPAVWDPTARGGEGGWVRRPAPGTRPTGPAAPVPAAGPYPGQGATGPGAAGPGATGPGAPGPGATALPPVSGRFGPPMAPPPAPGAVGDQGPPLVARPYLTPGAPSAPPTAPPGTPAGSPPPPAGGAATPPWETPRPAAAGGFPDHATAQGGGRATAPPPMPSAPPGPPGGLGFDATAAIPRTPAQAPPPFAQPHPQPSYGQPFAQAGYPPQAPGGINLPGRYEELEPAGPDPDGRPRRRGPLLVGAGLVLLLAIGGGTVLALQNSGSTGPTAKAAPPVATAPTGSPAPGGTATGAPSGAASAGSSASASASASAGSSVSPNAQAEAQALDALLTQGESARAPISSAVALVGSCPAKSDIDSAAQTLNTGAQQRDQLVAALAKLNMADVPGGADAVASLKTAWQESGDIDRAYAAWAKTVGAQGCGGGNTAPDTPDKQRADQLNPQATQAKKDFVTKWSALAGTYGLTAPTWDRI